MSRDLPPTRKKTPKPHHVGGLILTFLFLSCMTVHETINPPDKTTEKKERISERNGEGEEEQ